jgi:hypothetical protein
MYIGETIESIGADRGDAAGVDGTSESMRTWYAGKGETQSVIGGGRDNCGLF